MCQNFPPPCCIYFSQTMSRLAELEKEKENLQTDNEVKLEVVTQTTKEVGDLRQNLGKFNNI